ncbi:Rpn family recombination-promoting nuclease/putative transposase [Anabaena aphanizomenioides LEGE 00250]|uniref:Rpn family recombination-promoting nuclease/putative transposase n=2 Tax=Sphaerospermopsis TaxID=752201 RepID=A0ABR9VEN1_9CYAN|nr:DUF4351 domain-containing protein [Sphaerospermopsis aphanizomenoides]MBE9236938.1 Rpn family recombination-promoting nuclease/putative transposase [Sphaerospermopsis aphanizomenoides LEGE 00250]
MPKKADIGGKRLISLAPNTWVKWITQRSDLQVQDILNTEFQWIERESDVLLKVLSPEIGEFLLLNELQLRYNQKMPRRIRAYTALAEERYNLPVYPVLINILPPSSKQSIPQRYESEILGIRAYQDYQVINLWEVDVNLVFEQKISTLLPFVPILQGGNREDKLRQAVRELRRDEQLQDLEPLLSFFASFVLDIPLVQQIMRWDMTVLRESPWYEEILKEGLQQGEKQGLQQGLQQGRQQGRLEGETQLVIRLLQRRLGTLDDTLKQQIQMLPVEQLESLAEELLDFRDVEQLQTWLESLS